MEFAGNVCCHFGSQNTVTRFPTLLRLPFGYIAILFGIWKILLGGDLEISVVFIFFFKNNTTIGTVYF